MLVDEIGVGVKGLRKKVKNIVELQDVVEQKQKPIENKIDKNIKRLKRDNDQLKNIIEKVSNDLLSSNPTDAVSSSPSSFCWPG